MSLFSSIIMFKYDYFWLYEEEDGDHKMLNSMT